MSSLIIANWKSQKSSDQVKLWISTVSSAVLSAGVNTFADESKQDRGVTDAGHASTQTEVVLAPPFPLLPVASDVIRSANQGLNPNISLAAQDVSQYPLGAYTGAVTARHLKEWDVSYCIVGHSERRQYFHETSQDIAAKIDQLTTENILPVLCVDEPYIEEQARALLSPLPEGTVIAYEPVSAIGSGNAADVGHVSTVIKRIRELYGVRRVLYGGSVTELNIHEYLMVSDGVLVGSASLDAEIFSKLVQAAQI